MNTHSATSLMGLMDCLFDISAEFEITKEEAVLHTGENELTGFSDLKLAKF